MDMLISVLKMVGGLVLLIYGMKILSTNLKKLSGGKLETILINVTDNPFKALFVGFLITVATQSSAATTVLVVGLVNSGILKLKNAIPIIMGANIGTTMNSQILRLANLSGNSWITLFTPATFAPILLLFGLIIMERSKHQKNKDIGQMILGLGILFTGMITMVNTASTFSQLPILGEILEKLSNPVLGVIVGALITALVQSSSATVGILLALSTTGQITFATAVPIILGQNIGTCITSILASIGGNKNAKRVAAVHLYFNLIGTIIFMIFIYAYQSLVGFSFWDDAVDMGMIANFHTIFNIVSSIILFPFRGLLEKLTIFTVRESKKDMDEDSDEEDYLSTLSMLDERVVNIPGVAISNSLNVMEKMGELAEKNFRRTMHLLKEFDTKKINHIEEREDAIDKMEENLTKYLTRLANLDLSIEENTSITALLKIQSEFEKIGDYDYRLLKTIESIQDKNIKFSDIASKELDIIYRITEDTLLTTIQLFKEKDLRFNIEIQALRELAEIKREGFKLDHIQRLKKGECNVESGIAFLEILTVCEKITDHCLNVSIVTTNYVTNETFTTKQDFYNRIYNENSQLLKDKFNEYSLKYVILNKKF